MRGEQESRCLDRVREHLYGDKIRFFCRDWRMVASILERAKPNLEASKFPDFVFRDGFIEHFQITASKENKKGSCHKQKQAEFHREMDGIQDKLRQELEQMPLPMKNTISTTSYEMIPPEYSYKMFQSSFRENWGHHICSLKKYTGAKNIGIFLVEYVGPLFKTMREGEFVHFYQLQEDVAMLHFLDAYKAWISYVVFTDGQFCEVIDLQQIPLLMEQAPKDISFEAGRYRESNLITGVDIVDMN
ncbi:hypothetical protein [Faecalibacterium sp. An122]|uniref:hypothetical protein n=1 Tax=Faecalibacterium sp. An122 TaxID=1965551 RepID=UPI000B38D591|nr:hypothetical protein [Faecalibacterium sp. An122]OUQ35299.1 hypothetical protein B5E67_12045 [Faecalibacterium sp. An122]